MRLLTLLLIIYYVLTMLFPHGDKSVEAQRIYPQVLMACICIYIFLITWQSRILIYCNSFLYNFIPLVFIVFLYIPYPYESPNGTPVLYANFLWVMKNIMAIPFMFFTYIKLQDNEKRNIKYVYIIYAIQLLYAFYSLVYDRLVNYTRVKIDEGFDSNAGFILICCLPMALLLPIKRLRLYLTSILCLACIYSGQRSAALSAAISIPFCFSSIKGAIKQIDYLFFSILLFFVGLPILSDSIDNILLRNSIDVKRGQIGSGRGEFWKHVWNGVWDNPILSLIGHGTCSVPYLLKRTYGLAIFAHNGLLDYLYMYGIIGWIMYVKPLWTMLKYNKIYNSVLLSERNVLLAVFIVFLVKCSTSHGNWDISVMPLALCLAVLAHKFTNATNIKNT